jgi:hypothetical protein
MTRAPEVDHAPQQDEEIDLHRLTELVYRLMQAEVRLGRARGEAW